MYYKATTKKHRDEILLGTENIENTHKIFKDFMRKKGFISQEEKNSINKIVEQEDNKEKREREDVLIKESCDHKNERS